MADTAPPPRAADPMSHWLDAFRWMAAVAVMIAHVAMVMVPPYATLVRPGATAKLFLFSAGFAHQAVMIFFVLSGYLVGGSFLRDVERRRVNIRRYMLKRLARLWIVVIPALAIAFLLATISIRGLGNGDFGPYVMLQDERLSLASFVGTALFTNTWLVQPFAFDLPLWSIANEFLYYVAWPILVLGIVNRRAAASWIMMAATLGALGWISSVQFAGSPTLPYFIPWLLGAAASTVDPGRFAKRAAVPGALFAAVLLCSRFVLRSDVIERVSPMLFAWDCGVALVFAVLLVAMRRAKLSMPPLAAMHAPLANCSFSLYCLHYPVTIFLASVLRPALGLGYHMPVDRASTWIVVSGTLALNLVVAYAFAAVTERNTDRVRTAVERLLDGRVAFARRSKA